MQGLHEHETEILRFLEEYQRSFFHSPSVEDIRVAVKLRSKDHVHRDLDKLEEKGYISRKSRLARSIRLLRLADGRSLAERAFSLVQIPLLGSIAAGQPIIWPDSSSSLYEREMIELTQEMVGRRQGLYALKVKGESMVDAMVYDGDIVIMQPYAGRPSNGEIVAIWLKDPGATTLKKFYWEEDRVRLQPCNPTMSPIYADPRNVQVQGKLVAVIRQVA